MLAFYLLGLIMDRSVRYEQKKNILIYICAGFAVLIIKSFFGMASPPFYYNNGVKVVMSVICTILEVAVIVAIAICINNISQMANQRNLFFYNEEEEVGDNFAPEPEPEPIIAKTNNEDDIWEDERRDSKFW